MTPERKSHRILILLIYLLVIAYKTYDLVKAYRRNDAFNLYWSAAMVAILTIIFIVLLIRYTKKPA